MKKLSKLDLAWLILMVITLLNTLVAETVAQSHFITAVICFSIAFKGRLVIDHFMELNKANSTIKNLVRSYFYFFPMLVLVCDIFAAQLVLITTIS
ncbi:cytochrome C oxidase subunit IV family protein [Thalassotalea sp. G2M2-11]|uniref:cytochrome C oxidase subunit IV family protein n=1 Tax=Thalassotalea sp. G2M2-11 TaxID=2787627 RepID=UPI0019D281A1|nr:cytochrome C oxidase subunit IV family protein [Thalassotalea sp. G2M2-11]